MTLQRSKNAREAIQTMINLTEKYGYASEGESFTISDPDEIWVMDFIARGQWHYSNGSRIIYVATRVPDGHICGHANFPRTMKINDTDPENCLFSEDILRFAHDRGYFNGTTFKEFDFTEAFSPDTGGFLRICDGRVWAYFREVLGPGVMDDYYQNIVNNTGPRMNFSYPVPADQKVSLRLLQRMTGSHADGSPLNASEDVSSGYQSSPYRARMLFWQYNNTDYLFERHIGVLQTGWSFAAQCRPATPGSAGGVFWYGVDDATLSVHVPFYTSVNRVPGPFTRDHANMMQFSFDSMFWINSLVSNWAYTNWEHISPEVFAKQAEMRDYFDAAVRQADETIIALARRDPQVAKEFMNQICDIWANKQLEVWREYFFYLFWRFFDGVEHFYKPGVNFPDYKYMPFHQRWYNYIAQETGDHYLVPDNVSTLEEQMLRRRIH
jgi:dipeptidase